MQIPGLRSQPFFDDKSNAFWVLQTMGWLFYLLLRMASALGSGSGFSALVLVLVSAITGYSVTSILGAVYHIVIGRRAVYTWVSSALAGISAIAVYATIDVWVYALVDRTGANFVGATFLSVFFVDALLILAWSALYFGINFYIIVEHQADALRELEHQASSAQLAMLRYQLNPHFLFNTLNSISTLVLLKQTERANVMLSRLSSFLRYTLANEPTAYVTLAQEVEMLKLYLEIEKMRFDERLRSNFQIEPLAQRARLPSLLLQPLIENAIKYAVMPSETGAEITVSARIEGDRVRITVEDSGPGRADASAPTGLSTGVGLANIRDRLAQAFGADHRFEATSYPDGGFGAIIDIPFRDEMEQAGAQ
ncbi:MAG: histidine kinase [Alphaproteobacteria bacterium]|nr:histidine kinase [Alphaproteobacteria bacterium]